MSEHFTILGAGGFIGRHLGQTLRQEGAKVVAPARREGLPAGPLGHVIYCIGLTADFRTRPLDTMEAHVCRLREVLGHGDFDSLLYLSSTRVYGGASDGCETASIAVDPASASDLYNISKLAGEALCFAQDDDRVRIARLANVFGTEMAPDTFLAALICAAIEDRHIALQTAREAVKDYIAIEDVSRAVIRIARAGRERIYNIASGYNITTGEIVDALAELTNATVSIQPDAPSPSFPPISTERIRSAMACAAPWQPERLTDALPALVAAYRARLLEPAGVN